jgi:vesicular inhibitory amino acid transporter
MPPNPLSLTSRQHAPGSLRDPAHTDLFPSHGWVKFGTVLGLLISGVRSFYLYSGICSSQFGGHGLIPNLVHDMKHPKQADRACEVAYLISMIVYLLVAICGYIMYGTSVSDEVSSATLNL